MYDDLIRTIAKGHVLKADISFHCMDIHRMFHCLILFFLFQKFKDAFGSCNCGLQHIRNLGNLLYRLRKVSDILEEGLNIAHLNGTFDR